jgi:4'-phosphopantetheinyl transferase
LQKASDSLSMKVMESVHPKSHEVSWESLRAPGTIHIWRVSLGQASKPEEQLEAILAPEERQRYQGFRFPIDKWRYLVSHYALRMILSQYAKTPPQDLGFGLGKFGKPFLTEPVGGQGLTFNLSHCRDLALVAVAAGRNVGVDVEEVRKVGEKETILNSYFDAEERDFLQRHQPEQRDEAFLRIWTRREAAAKCLGMDIGTAVEALSVPIFEPEGCISFPFASRDGNFSQHDGTKLLLQDLRFDTPHVGALCCEDGPCELVRFQFHE